MPVFVALIYENGNRPDPTAPDFVDFMGGYSAFGELAGPAITGGAPLLGPETATTIQVRGGEDGELVLTDGPFAETKEWLGGFYLLEADDLDGAIALARHIPAAWRDGGKVEVRPAWEM
ncbi:MAG: YciI family protein [Acidimicrobiia bacterium]|jgi:hypothetical protein